MAKPKLELRIPRQSLIYIAFCLLGVFIFLFAGILPASRTLEELDARKSAVQYGIEEQKTLAPLQQAFREIETRKHSDVLVLPERSRLPQAKINTLSLNLRTVAQMSGMNLLSANPNLKAMAGDAQFLPVSIVLRGDFDNFRKFLIRLGALPYLERIEEITIQSKPDAREYRLTLWVAIG